MDIFLEADFLSKAIREIEIFIEYDKEFEKFQEFILRPLCKYVNHNISLETCINTMKKFEGKK